MTGHLEVVTVETNELGNRSYIAHDGEIAIVIDPQRDLDRILEPLEKLGLRISLVCDTHVHNDYLSGGLALANYTKTPYALSAADKVDFNRLPVDEGLVAVVGSLTVHAIRTPGHTPGHLAYVIKPAEHDPVLFSGGSMLYGSVGRTDLIDPEQTTELARAQYRSVRRLATELPPHTQVFPTHGFGSFCSSLPTAQVSSGTLAEERLRNPALYESEETEFVDRMVASFTPYPTYYERMAPRNRRGVERPDLSPPPTVSTTDLRSRIDARQWVIDLRPRGQFAAEHIPGTLSFELGPVFGTYVGWLVPYGSPLTLLAPDAETLHAAQRQLVRVGWDRPDGAVVGRLDSMTEISTRGGYPVVGFDAITEGVGPGRTLIDVRRLDERANGFVPGSMHVPIHQLLGGIDDLPDGELWVHCASGFRASIAASLLARAGRDVVLVDDTFGRASELGLVG